MMTKDSNNMHHMGHSSDKNSERNSGPSLVNRSSELEDLTRMTLLKGQHPHYPHPAFQAMFSYQNALPMNMSKRDMDSSHPASVSKPSNIHLHSALTGHHQFPGGRQSPDKSPESGSSRKPSHPPHKSPSGSPTALNSSPPQIPSSTSIVHHRPSSLYPIQIPIQIQKIPGDLLALHDINLPAEM